MGLTELEKIIIEENWNGLDIFKNGGLQNTKTSHSLEP